MYSDDGVLFVQFSTPIRKDTAPAKTNFGYLEDNEWHEVTGTWAMEADRMVSFTPAASITETNPELRVQATAKDELGCMMGVQYATPVASDDTGEISYDDDAAPDVEIVFQEAYTDPQDEDNRLGKLVVHFTEVINADSLTDSQTSADRIALYEGDEITEDMRVEGTVTRLADKTVVEFLPDPAAQLRWGQPLILVIKAGIEDWSGNELQADQTYAFTYTEEGLLVHETADPRIIPESLAGNNLLFQGREWDQDVGMYYFRARYLDPETGRFTERDPMGYRDGMNLYAGLGANPVNFINPDGRLQILPPGYGHPDLWMQEFMDRAEKATRNGASWVVSFVPYASDAYDLSVVATGHDYILGRDVNPSERALIVAAAVTPEVGGRVFRIAAPIVDRTKGRLSRLLGKKTGRQVGQEVANLAENEVLAEATRLLGREGTSGSGTALITEERAGLTVSHASEGGARFGQATTTDYRRAFFDAHPEKEGTVVVHHAVERQTRSVSRTWSRRKKSIRSRISGASERQATRICISEPEK